MGIDNLRKKLGEQPVTVEQHFAEAKKGWIDDVAKLTSNMAEWLKPLVDEHTVRLEPRQVELNESDIGTYVVDALTIHLGDREVRVEPQGMRIVGVIPTGKDRIIGARGLISVVCGPSRATILRRSPGVWELATADGWPADKNAVALTQETFADLLAELIPDAHGANGC